MKAVFLDCSGVNPGDISWETIKQQCDFTYFETTTKEEAAERLRDSEAVFVDSFPITREIMEQNPKLKFIGIAATGFNHIDLEAAKELGIAVANVPAYSTDAVAQHAISLLLSVTNRVESLNQCVVNGKWQDCNEHILDYPALTLLAGKSIGIIGYGNIGKKVAQIAEALGMKVNIYSRDKEAAIKSDVVSLHCPLTPENTGMVDKEFLSKMKDGAILINTARGALLDEEAVAKALKNGKLAGAGLDVLANEPPQDNHPLIGLPNCWITPHIAFTPVETRRVVIETCGANLESFINGGTRNRLV